jgi:hypothetical protein
VTVTKIGFGVSIGVDTLLEDKLDMVGVATDVGEGTEGLGVDEDPPSDEVDVVVDVGVDEDGVGVDEDEDEDFDALLELQLVVGAGAG